MIYHMIRHISVSPESAPKFVWTMAIITPYNVHMPSCLTIDVEDWFHILDIQSAPSIDQWSNLPGRVETNFRKLIEILGEHDVRATCFFLGWIAEKYPHLVRKAVSAGHEIASHGYNHRLIYRQSRDEFREDVLRSKNILENITGSGIIGFRGSGFSLTDKTPWYFDVLEECGFRYDSTVFPARRGHGGMPDAPLKPYRIGNMVEIPLTVADILGRKICFFGGGYFRLFPGFLIAHMANKVLEEGRPVIWYLHPREIDPDHPRLPMPPYRKFKSYVNLRGVEKKLKRILEGFEFETLVDYIAGHGRI